MEYQPIWDDAKPPRMSSGVYILFYEGEAGTLSISLFPKGDMILVMMVR